MHAGALFQHRHQKVDTVIIRSGRRSSWQSEIRITDQCLYFYQHRACAFHQAYHNRPRSVFRLSAQHIFRRILHFHKSLLLHFKHADFIGRAKAVFHTAQQAVRGIFIAFKIQHGIHHVFKHARTCNNTFLCHMTDNKNGNTKSLCKLHKNCRGFPHLTDTARRRTDVLTIHCLNGVNNYHIRHRLFHRFFYDVQIGFT